MANTSTQIPRTMSPKWNDQGLMPVITQDADSGEVLMLAWMNAAALELTLTSGDVVYWSRSRRELWRKGATSGNTQQLVEARLDCDGDTLLLRVHQTGGACHTGRPNCFFYVPHHGEWHQVAEE
jgi:phosphoribosyl-AMP cyclohydrolase